MVVHHIRVVDDGGSVVDVSTSSMPVSMETSTVYMP